MDKEEIRQKIWKLMEETNIASFPRPVFGRIPNFKGSEKAAEILSTLPEFKKAEVVKVNPDSPQRKVRELVLSAGKKLLVPTPRLKGEFFLIYNVNPKLASTISGFTKLGKRISYKEIPPVDFIVVGSVAVTRSGDRVGKGEGYSELEYAILRELGKVNEKTPVATTVHSIQIVDEIPSQPFDVPVDIIVTEKEIIRTKPNREKPKGIYMEYLTKEKIEETPYLKYYLMETGRLK
ncbi:5-formyltetrahydrofolate cyclo-ligase [Acidianus ambivalens]|uniref:5-formyltetrahydrofolate cyclo-ligase n=1 Tax=Acidianus ambivalens TaxID=2283 RepID=A0A650CVR3_ACIAM|nr:5-formyltetrahydrofolate cyclo-ligase [Acidianus ambivalens]MQL55550.1 5-formyltetrahydrofolate cyclo-ligase [Acidianus ambivalens]QGR21863.1 5-formyltetrahydrofolate cyclo-ligase [Acidianus ambivalens]